MQERDITDAQNSAEQAMKQGFDSSDADALYTQPEKLKWQIIAGSPALMNDPSLRSRMMNEVGNATEKFQKLYKEYSVDGGQWALEQSGLQPTLAKWQELTPTLDTLQKSKDTQEKNSAIIDLMNAKSPQEATQIAKSHPELLSNSGAQTALREAMRGDFNKTPQDEITKANIANGRSNLKMDLQSSNPDPEKIAEDLSRITPNELIPSQLADPKTGAKNIYKNGQLVATSFPPVYDSQAQSQNLSESEPENPSAGIPVFERPRLYITGNDQYNNATPESFNAPKPPTYTSPYDVRLDFKKGIIDKNRALQILKSSFGMK